MDRTEALRYISEIYQAAHAIEMSRKHYDTGNFESYEKTKKNTRPSINSC